MVREASKEEKESRRKDKEQEKKEMAKKWFQPEPEQRLSLEGYTESRSRRDNDNVWMLPQQCDKHWVKEKSTEGVGAGEVSENDCVSFEQTQVNNLRMNVSVSVLNTSRVKIKNPKLAVTEASTVLEKGKVTPN